MGLEQSAIIRQAARDLIGQPARERAAHAAGAPFDAFEMPLRGILRSGLPQTRQARFDMLPPHEKANVAKLQLAAARGELAPAEPEKPKRKTRAEKEQGIREWLEHMTDAQLEGVRAGLGAGQYGYGRAAEVIERVLEEIAPEPSAPPSQEEVDALYAELEAAGEEEPPWGGDLALNPDYVRGYGRATRELEERLEEARQEAYETGLEDGRLHSDVELGEGPGGLELDYEGYDEEGSA
jgi:hypothetical protein